MLEDRFKEDAANNRRHLREQFDRYLLYPLPEELSAFTEQLSAYADRIMRTVFNHFEDMASDDLAKLMIDNSDADNG